jgi:hypothetical protein
MDIKKITSEEANEIIVNRIPLGRFYVLEKGEPGEKITYVGIDNEHGHAWVEDFKSLSACKRWLGGTD